MCVLTFVPLQDGNFIFTSNRDEFRTRGLATPIRKHRVGNNIVFFPTDEASGGSWFAVGSNTYSVCLLNGAFEPHERKLPYKKSRGTMLKEFFLYRDLSDFGQHYNFKGIEPFTFVVVCNANPFVNLYELRWDGQQIHFAKLDPNEAHIWSSVTLYTEKERQNHKTLFGEALKNQEKMLQENIINIHKKLVKRKTTAVAESQETLSITSVEAIGKSYQMSYLDMLTNKLFNYKILDFKNEVSSRQKVFAL